MMKMESLKTHHQSLHNQVIERPSILVLLLLFSLCLGLIYTSDFIPDNVYIEPFPFYKVSSFETTYGHAQLSLSTHLYFIGEQLRMVMILFIVWVASPVLVKELFFVLALQVLELADYMLIYNQKWFTLYGVDIDFTYFQYVFYVAIIFNCLKKNERVL